jgi:hypothetical protein
MQIKGDLNAALSHKDFTIFTVKTRGLVLQKIFNNQRALKCVCLISLYGAPTQFM